MQELQYKQGHPSGKHTLRNHVLSPRVCWDGNQDAIRSQELRGEEEEEEGRRRTGEEEIDR